MPFHILLHNLSVLVNERRTVLERLNLWRPTFVTVFTKVTTKHRNIKLVTKNINLRAFISIPSVNIYIKIDS
jgi:hypothetical protein